MHEQAAAIVLYDGWCNLCDYSVQFILKRDKNAYFKFAALQSETGKKLQEKYNLPTDTIDTIVLIEADKAYLRSTAGLRIARKLNRLWPILYVFIMVPPFIRNLIYRFIARNRYKWFGKKDACAMPTPDIKARFLD